MTETQTPAKPNAPKTDLSELMALFGRFFSAILFMVLTIVMMLKHNYVISLVTALAAAFTQQAAIKLYRRLRDERTAALEAMQGAPAEEISHAA